MGSGEADAQTYYAMKCPFCDTQYIIAKGSMIACTQCKDKKVVLAVDPRGNKTTTWVGNSTVE